MFNLKFSVNLKNVWYKIYESFMVLLIVLYVYVFYNMEIFVLGYVE